MTVGQLAAKAGVSVRTLQYYHKEGILVPSAQSEGGRRLYTDKDMVMLQQILSLKYLGFSLEEIRDQIIPLDTTEQVHSVLENQKAEVRERIERLKGVLAAIDALQEDILSSDSVDFSRYSGIVAAIHEKWEHFWMIGKMDDTLAGHALRKFDVHTGKEISARFQALIERFVSLNKENVAPESLGAQDAAKAWWEMVIDFTGGDMSLMPQLYSVYLQRNLFDESWQAKWAQSESLMQKALQVYLEVNNIHVDFPAINNREEI